MTPMVAWGLADGRLLGDFGIHLAPGVKLKRKLKRKIKNTRLKTRHYENVPLPMHRRACVIHREAIAPARNSETAGKGSFLRCPTSAAQRSILRSPSPPWRTCSVKLDPSNASKRLF